LLRVERGERVRPGVASAHDMEPQGAVVLVLTIAAALAGCSTQSATPAATATQPVAQPTTQALATPATTAPPAASGDALAAAAAKVGCAGYAQSADPAPNADKWGTCTINSKKVQIYQITGDAAYKAFLDSVKAYGVTEAWLVRSGNLVVSPSDQTQLDAIRTKLNG